MCPDPGREVIDTGEVVVVRVQGFIDAEQVLAALRANGIEARTRGEAMGEVAGLTLNGIGLTEILVPPEHAEAAREFLAAADRGELELSESEDLPGEGADRG